MGNRYPPDGEQIPVCYEHFNGVYQIKTHVNRCPHLKVRILTEEIEGLADTGASVSVLSSLDLISKLGLKVKPFS